MLMNGKPCNAFVSAIQFGVFTEKEILERSVVEVTHDVAFDRLGYPNKSGLYDLKMGPYQRDARCGTCNKPWIDCPGHFGHIALASPMYNPNLFGYIYDLMKSKCFFCHRLRVPELVLKNIEAQLILLDAGMYSEALKIGELSADKKIDELGKEDMEVEDAVDLSGEKENLIQKYLKQAHQIIRERNGIPTVMTSAVQEVRNSLYKLLIKRVTERCQHCHRVSPKLFKQGAIKIFRGKLNSKAVLRNMKYGKGVLSDDVFKYDLEHIERELNFTENDGVVTVIKEGKKGKDKETTKDKKSGEKEDQDKKVDVFKVKNMEESEESDDAHSESDKENSEVVDDTVERAGQGDKVIKDRDEDGVLSKSSAARLYMPSVEIKQHIKYLFKNHKTLFNNLFGEPKVEELGEDEEETKASRMARRRFSHKQLFFTALPVVPTRFRLPNTMADSRSITGKAYYDSPINMILTRIIQSNNVLKRFQFFCQNEDAKTIINKFRVNAQTGANFSIDSSFDELQKQLGGMTTEEKQGRLLYASLKLQDDINLLCDSTKCINVASMAMNKSSDNNRASASSSTKVLNGLRQTIEKKQGIVRKNLMGKRVNYAGRSVISPDPYISTDEIGIPVMFAMTMSFPEPVNEGCIVKNSETGQFERRTTGNIKVLRKLVINGPSVYPGANYIITENNNTILLGRLSQEMRESIAKSLGRTVVENADTKVTEASSIGRVKVVGRHLLNGDPLLVNRQPTLHRNSIMCHKAYVFDTTEKPSGERINYNGNGFGNSFSVNNISNILNDSAITTNRNTENWNNMYVINNFKPRNIPNVYKMSTIRMHFTNCQSYNADFDGDEINVHCPQSYEARTEALNLMLNDSLYSSITSGAPIRGIIQDHVVSGVMLTKRNTFLDRKTFMELVFVGCNSIDPNIPVTTHNDYSVSSKKHKETSESKKTSLNKVKGLFEISSVVDRPAVLYPKRMYTGKQVVTQMLLHLSQSRGMPPLNLVGDTKIPIKLWMDSNHLTADECKSQEERAWYFFDNSTVIRQGELLAGLIEKNHISNTANGLIHTINDTYGNINNNPSNPEANGSASGRMLTAMGRMLQRYIQYIGFTCRLEDMILAPKGDAERALILGKMNAKAIEGVKEFLELDLASKGEDLSASFIQKALVTKLKHIQKQENSMPGSHGSKGLGSPLLDSLVTSQMNGVTSECINTVVPTLLLNNSYTNNLNMMITSKAKGSNVNQSQIVVCLGQQSLEGRRPPMLPTGRTLPLYETIYSKIATAKPKKQSSTKGKYVIKCPVDVDSRQKIGSETFGKFSQSAHANGYISGRFLTGLPAPSFYFHCMAGREGLVDTAVKTANSGYLQRCLVKGLENITVAYNGMTIENIGSSKEDSKDGKFNGGGNVIQFLYGEDGRSVDATIANGIPGISMNWKIYAERLNRMMKNIPSSVGTEEGSEGGDKHKTGGLGNMSSKSIKNKLGYLGFTRVMRWQKERKKILKATSKKHKKSKAEKSKPETILKKECSKGITCLPPHLNFGSISDKFQADVESFVSKNTPKLTAPQSASSSSRSSSGKKKHKKSKQQSETMSQSPEDQSNLLLSPNDLFSRNVALKLDEAGHLALDKLKLVKPKSLFSILSAYSYYHSLVHPLSPVGVISAESIGEPSTQMTLNTFHQAGVGGANVTMGIPRLRQILMSGTVSGKPSMTIKAPQGAEELNSLEALRSLVTNVTVIDIINKLTCVEKIGTGLTILKGEEARTRIKDVAGRRREYHIALEIEKNKILPNGPNTNAAAIIQMRLVRLGFLNLLMTVSKLLYKEGLGRRIKAEDAEEKDADASVIIKKRTTKAGDVKKKGKASGDDKEDEQEPEYDPDVMDKDAEKDSDDEEEESEGNENENENENENGEENDEGKGDTDNEKPTDTSDKPSDKTKKSQGKKAAKGKDGASEEMNETQKPSTSSSTTSATSVEALGDTTSAEVAMKQFIDAFTAEEKASMMKVPTNIVSGVRFIIRKADEAKTIICSTSTSGLDLLDFLGKNKDMDFSELVRGVVFRFEFIISCPLNQRKLLITNIIERAAIATPLRSVKGIEGGYLDVKEKKLLCNGQNFRYINKLPDTIVDHRQIRTTDIKEILRVYGVEAARRAIIEEISNVFNMYHIDVNVRHISLIADKMTHNGQYLTFSRHGLLHASEAPVIQRMSFETALTSMTVGCIRGEADYIGGNGIVDGHNSEWDSVSNLRGIGGAAEGNVSAAVTVGRCIPIGTGGIDLFTKIPTREEEEVMDELPQDDQEDQEEEQPNPGPEGAEGADVVEGVEGVEGAEGAGEQVV